MHQNSSNLAAYKTNNKKIMAFEQEIRKLILSKNNFIYIKAYEEERLEYSLNQISKTIFQNHLYTWDFINGYKNHPSKKLSAIRNPLEALNTIEITDTHIHKIFFLKDFDDFINEILIIRKLKNLYQLLKGTNIFIIISSVKSEIPISLQDYISIIEFPLPNKTEIKIELERLTQILKLNQSSIDTLITAYQGFSINQIRNSIIQLVSQDKINDNIIQMILAEKQQMIKQTDILEFYNSSDTLADIGGIKNLKKWLRKRSTAFQKETRQYGIPIPKGILLIGIQGTGKSISAKAISLEWNLPLLKLDIGKIFAGIVGESESRMRQMFKLAEKMSPCLLWIDEIDKIFTKNSISNDSGTTNRVMNGIISWLSEKNSNIFIVATANDISNLPTEILRKGRFDEIFFLDLPNFEERLNIFKIHLKKVRPLTWNNYNIYYLSKLSYNFSGAEIQQAIIDAMYNAFDESREFNTEDVILSIQTIIPLAYLDEKNISKIQELAYSGKVQIA